MLLTGSQTFPHKNFIPKVLIVGIDCIISVTSTPATSSSKTTLITIKIRLKMVSHFICAYERSNLSFFFIRYNLFISDMSQQSSFPLQFSVTFNKYLNKDRQFNLSKLWLVYTTQLPAPFMGTGNCICLFRFGF